MLAAITYGSRPHFRRQGSYEREMMCRAPYAQIERARQSLQYRGRFSGRQRRKVHNLASSGLVAPVAAMIRAFKLTPGKLVTGCAMLRVREECPAFDIQRKGTSA